MHRAKDACIYVNERFGAGGCHTQFSKFRRYINVLIVISLLLLE